MEKCWAKARKSILNYSHDRNEVLFSRGLVDRFDINLEHLLCVDFDAQVRPTAM